MSRGDTPTLLDVNGDLFQYASLVMFGSDFLANQREHPELFPEHSSFGYVGERHETSQ